jgi:hypothetical protein
MLTIKGEYKTFTSIYLNSPGTCSRARRGRAARTRGCAFGEQSKGERGVWCGRGGVGEEPVELDGAGMQGGNALPSVGEGGECGVGEDVVALALMGLNSDTPEQPK